MTTSQATPSAGSDPVDLVEWYFEQGWTDGLPVVPPTPAKVDATIDALGGMGRKDASREHSPLRTADDAIVVDTTDKTIDQVISFIIEQIQAHS